jgi:hypothetical protein
MPIFFFIEGSVAVSKAVVCRRGCPGRRRHHRAGRISTPPARRGDRSLSGLSDTVTRRASMVNCSERAEHSPTPIRLRHPDFSHGRHRRSPLGD